MLRKYHIKSNSIAKNDRPESISLYISSISQDKTVFIIGKYKHNGALGWTKLKMIEKINFLAKDNFSSVR